MRVKEKIKNERDREHVMEGGLQMNVSFILVEDFLAAIVWNFIVGIRFYKLKQQNHKLKLERFILLEDFIKYKSLIQDL